MMLPLDFPTGLLYEILDVCMILSLDQHYHVASNRNIVYFEKAHLYINMFVEANNVFHHHRMIID